MSSVRKSMAQGAVWMVMFKLLDRSLGLISTLILARLLVPADFGLVAMATALIAVLELFSMFGLDIALIQKSGATREHYDTAWTLNVLAGLCVAGGMLLLAWPMSLFYGEPRLIALVCVLALGAGVQGMQNIGVVAFRKELNFDREFRFLAVKRILTFCVSVPLALWLRSYWALALGIVFGRCAGVAISYLLHPFRPKFSLQHVREFMHFSKWLMFQNLLNFLKERSPDFIVGRIAGAHAVGVLSIATEIVSMPGSELIAPINRAALPGYAKLRDDPPAMRREYVGVASLVSLAVTPVIAGIALVAPIIVVLMLGAKWHEAAMIINLMAFVGITNIFLGTAYAPLLAMGKPAIFGKISAIHVAIAIPAIIVLTHRYGVTGAAMGQVFTAIGLLPLNVVLVLRTIEMRAATLLREVWRPIAASSIMYVVTKLAMPPIDIPTLGNAEAIALLATYVPLGASIYVVALTLLWLACGRPEGAELIVTRQLIWRWQHARGVLARRLTRGAPPKNDPSPP